MKIYSKLLPYTLSYIIPVAAIMGITQGGLWTYSAFAIAFVLLPFFELFTGTSEENLSSEEEMKLKDNHMFSLLLWGHVIFQYLILIFFLFTIRNNLHGWEITGCILSTGVMFGGIGITVAHELIHRKSKFEQFLGKALLLSTCYIHFYIEHIRGHHKYVGTRDDPASAKYGQSFYRFWIQTVFGSYINAWKLESARLKKKNLSPFSLSNQMVRFTAVTLIFIATIIFYFGINVFYYYLITSIIGFSLLELVNYVEHYGLSRNKTEKGKFEKVNALHSWNSNNYFSRRILFELTRHSDHHLYASKKYQLLRSIEESPALPTGYSGMIILALIPPLWFKVMNKRVNKIIDAQTFKNGQ